MVETGSAIVDNLEPERVPLDWLLARPELGLAAHYLPDRSAHLAWAHAIEIEDPSPWLRGPGLVLTTGLRLPRTKQGQEEYVARLATAGAVALGFGTGLRFAAIPFAVAAACREHRLALVEVPLPTPFLAVVQAVAERLGELRRLQLQESQRRQRELTSAALAGGVDAVVRGLARVLRAGVHLVTADATSLARAGHRPPRLAEVLHETAPDPARSVLVEAGGRRLEIQPVLAASQALGWVALRRDVPLSPAERLVLSHAVALVTLELARPRAADGAGVPAGLVLDALLSARTLRPEDLAAGLGWDPGALQCLVVARGTGPEPVARHASRHALVVAGDGVDRVELIASADRVEALLAALPASVAAAVGTPTTVTGLPAQRAPVHELLDRAEPGRPVRLADSPVERALADPRVADAAHPWLATLRAHDAEQGSDLVASLRAFLAHHGAWDPAAQSLGVHRHTLRHRVERARALAGFDLDDARHRALLTLALAQPAPPASPAQPAPRAG